MPGGMFGGGGGTVNITGVSEHNQLGGLTIPNQHTIAVIIGLQAEIDKITANTNRIITLENTVATIENIINNPAGLEARLITIEGDVFNIKNDITGIQGDIVTINNRLNGLDTKTDLTNNNLDAEIQARTDADDTINTDIGTINSTLTTIISGLTQIQQNAMFAPHLPYETDITPLPDGTYQLNNEMYIGLPFNNRQWVKGVLTVGSTRHQQILVYTNYLSPKSQFGIVVRWSDGAEADYGNWYRVGHSLDLLENVFVNPASEVSIDFLSASDTLKNTIQKLYNYIYTINKEKEERIQRLENEYSIVSVVDTYNTTGRTLLAYDITRLDIDDKIIVFADETLPAPQTGLSAMWRLKSKTEVDPADNWEFVASWGIDISLYATKEELGQAIEDLSDEIQALLDEKLDISEFEQIVDELENSITDARNAGVNKDYLVNSANLLKGTNLDYYDWIFGVGWYINDNYFLEKISLTPSNIYSSPIHTPIGNKNISVILTASGDISNYRLTVVRYNEESFILSTHTLTEGYNEITFEVQPDTDWIRLGISSDTPADKIIISGIKALYGVDNYNLYSNEPIITRTELLSIQDSLMKQSEWHIPSRYDFEKLLDLGIWVTDYLSATPVVRGMIFANNPGDRNRTGVINGKAIFLRASGQLESSLLYKDTSGLYGIRENTLTGTNNNFAAYISAVSPHLVVDNRSQVKGMGISLRLCRYKPHPNAVEVGGIWWAKTNLDEYGDFSDDVTNEGGYYKWGSNVGQRPVVMPAVLTAITNPIESFRNTRYWYNTPQPISKTFRQNNIQLGEEFETDELFMGMKVYQKAVNYGKLPAVSNSAPHGIDLSKTLILEVKGIAFDNYKNTYLQLPFASPVANENIKIEIGASIVITTGQDRSAYNAIIFIRYCKWL